MAGQRDKDQGADGAPGPKIQSVKQALYECRLLFAFAVLFGVAVNLLLLTGPLYMLQVYDRVLVSGSFQTLVALSILTIGAYLALALIDYARAAVAAHAGLRVERLLGERLVRGSWSGAIGDGPGQGAELLRDLDTYRSFVGGPGLITATDLPFAPLFVAVIFLLHPWLGVFATISIIVLTAIALLAQILTRRRLAEANDATRRNARFVQSVSSASEPVRVMGMSGPLLMRWRDERDELVTKYAIAADRGARFKSTTKGVRLAVQSLILGLGAYLVLIHELSPGGMIAASIILGRALAPIEQALGVWSQLNAARSARESLDHALARLSEHASARAPTPTIVGDVALDRLSYTPPGSDRPILADLSLEIPAGASVGLIGPSGVGKSTLARLIVGALEPTRGCVRVDGGDVRNYDPEALGASIGYLPQNVGLLEGTVAENIARFRGDPDQAVFEAARRARAHELIQRLPGGYQTPVAADGANLSAGQRQRIGLARALYGEPRIVVLDEPNSNLDELGEAALQDAMEELSTSRVTTIVITHRATLVENVDALLVLSLDGSAMFGPRKAVLERINSSGAAGSRVRVRRDADKPAGGEDG